MFLLKVVGIGLKIIRFIVAIIVFWIIAREACPAIILRVRYRYLSAFSQQIQILRDHGHGMFAPVGAHGAGATRVKTADVLSFRIAPDSNHVMLTAGHRSQQPTIF
jgi:hypothetical protein